MGVNKGSRKVMNRSTKIGLGVLMGLGIGFILFSKTGLSLSSSPGAPSGTDYENMFLVILRIGIGVLLLLIAFVTVIVKYIVFYLRKEKDDLA